MFELVEDEDLRQKWIGKNGQVIKRAQLLSMRFLLLMIGYIAILHSLSGLELYENRLSGWVHKIRIQPRFMVH